MKNISLNRNLIKISGNENKKFLQKLVTSDVFNLTAYNLKPACLLSPQGKILFSFLITTVNNDIYIDSNDSYLENLATRLNFYKLNADIELTIYNSVKTIISTSKELPFIDNRFKQPLYRTYQLFGTLPNLKVDTLNLANYYIENGIAYDIEPNIYFPHDLNFDLIGAVSFTKGCFIGQEVVARMQHKATLKKRCFIINSLDNLNVGDAIKAGEKIVGTVKNAIGNQGLAILRIEYLNEILNCNGNTIKVIMPYYLDLQ